MVMLILETFVLMLLSGLLGTALGSLLAEAYAADEPADRPWLRDLPAHPPLPWLPAAPIVLPDAERDRLLAALAQQVSGTPAPARVSAPAITEPQPEILATIPDAKPIEPVDATTPAAAAQASSVVMEKAPAIAEADATRAAEADAHGARPAGLLGPRGGSADDLKRIKGIGKQNEARLNALGVWHFDQIAAWTPENIRWAGSFLAFVGRIEREDWVGQAKILASGGTTEFADRVDAGAVPSSAS